MTIRLLVASDQTLCRNAIKSLLQKEPDFEVIGETENGIQTLLFLYGTPIDIVLLDLHISKHFQSEIIQEIFSNFANIYLILLILSIEEECIQKFLKLGVNGIILKNSKRCELLQAIRSVYKGEKYFDSELKKYTEVPPLENLSAFKKGNLELLTKREEEICSLLAYGYTNATIGRTLFLSQRTIESHRRSIMKKLGLKSRAELVQFAINYGLMKNTLNEN